MSLTIIAHLFAAVLIIVLPVHVARQFPRVRRLMMRMTERQRATFYVLSSVQLAVLAGAAVVSAYTMGHSATTLGLRELKPGSIIPALSIAIITLAAIVVLDRILLRRPGGFRKMRSYRLRVGPFLPRQWGELGAFSITCASAGIFEEILYRGFLYQYFALYVGSTSALLLSALFFALSHLYQGVLGVLLVFVLGVLLGVIVLLSESLWVAMALHFAIDIYAGSFNIQLWNRHRAQRALDYGGTSDTSGVSL